MTKEAWKPGNGPSPDYFKPYTDLDLQGYGVFLKYINQEFIDQARGLLRHAPLSADQCIILFGSDGKHERHAQSKTDIGIVQRPNPANLAPGKLMEWFDQTHTSTFTDTFDLKLHTEPEVKEVGDRDTVPLSDAYPYIFSDVRHNVYPDRMLNTVPILGNEDVYVEARRQVLEEMTADRNRSLRTRRTLVKQLGDYRKSMKTGIYRRQPTFTVDPPVQFYDEEESAYTTGFKIGFLRGVQRFLDIATVVGIREGFFSIDEAVSGLPTSTEERIVFLEDAGVISPNMEGKQVTDAYMWFLQQYHYAQEIYKRTRKPVQLLFDLGKFEVYSEMIIRFTGKGYLSSSRNFLGSGS